MNFDLNLTPCVKVKIHCRGKWKSRSWRKILIVWGYARILRHSTQLMSTPKVRKMWGFLTVKNFYFSRTVKRAKRQTTDGEKNICKSLM